MSVSVIDVIDEEGLTLDQIEFETGYVSSFAGIIYCILGIYDKIDGGIPSTWEIVKTNSEWYRIYKVPLPKVIYFDTL